MKLLSKLAISTSILLSISSTSLSAKYYTVQSGDSLSIIALKLGFDTVKQAGIVSVPSGDFSKIFPGDVIEYMPIKQKEENNFYEKVKISKQDNKKHTKKNRFQKRNKVSKKESNKKNSKSKFCFKDNRSIHYRASERCK